MSTSSRRRSGAHHGGGAASAHLARLGALTVVTVLSAALLAGAGYLWYNARGIDDAGQRVDVVVGHSPGADDIDGTAQNILLVGNDDRSNLSNKEATQLHVGKDGGSINTDTMMVVHVPADGSKATLISLPRDSYVAIPGLGGDGKDKLNAAYVYGYNRGSNMSTAQRQANGSSLLVQTVENLTGLSIDHYIQVSLLGFVRLSDAIGGVPIDLCQDVDDSRARNQAEGLGGGSGFKMSKGKHTVKGLTALEFVRQRHNFPDDREDLDRVKRQQYFLTSAFRQVAEVGVVTKLQAIRTALSESIIADQGLKLFDLARQMSDLSANNIVGRTIPTKVATLDDGTSILQVDPSRVKTFIDKLINPPAASPSSSPSRTATKPSTGSSTATASPSKSAAIDAKCTQ